MTSRIVFAFAFTLAAATSACGTHVSDGSGGSGGQGAGGSPGEGGRPGCTSDADCSSDDICVYDVKEACAARGTCQPRGKPDPCLAIGEAKACGCDGTEVDWQTGCSAVVPPGFAPAPIAHFGACGTPAQCTENSDCTPEHGYTPPLGYTTGECAYPRSEGCAARGECVDPFPACNSLVDVVGCACDGTRVDMGCGYPSKEWAPKPLAHLGPCGEP